MKPTIYIIGAGAIGITLAVFLKKAGHPVVILRGRAGQPGGVLADLRVDYQGEAIQAQIPVRNLETEVILDGLVVLTTKSFSNDAIARQLSGKTGHSPVVLLQNGIGVEEAFAASEFPAVYRCVLLATSQVISPFHVSYKPVAPSPVGVVSGNVAELAAIVDNLSTESFPFRAEPAIQPVIWEKAITNCVFNAVCTLLDVDNGLFFRQPEALSMARQIISECVAVAHESGIPLDATDVEERLLQISRRSDGQLISTLVDVKQGRETEIDSLNLAVGRIADRLGKPWLATRTRLLGELVRLKSGLSRNAGV